MMKPAWMIVVLLSLSSVAHAIPVSYNIEFTVESGTIFTFSDRVGDVFQTISQRDAIGSTYFGSFAVDDAVLASDGRGKSGVLDFFQVRIEDNLWGFNFPGDNSLAGFRGPIPGDDFCEVTAACLFAPSPGFDVVGGQITNLRGGVFGAGDRPFVDFSLPGDNMFNALGGLVPTTASTFSFLQGQGSMRVQAVAEPPVFALLTFGVLAVGAVWLRRARVR
jgi:hypothetical protein